MRSRLNTLLQVAQQCAFFCYKLGGNVLPPVFSCDKDVSECYLLSTFINKRAWPFIVYWLATIAAIDDGATWRTLKEIKAPPWGLGREQHNAQTETPTLALR
jgi:hypothetical protein